MRSAAPLSPVLGTSERVRVPISSQAPVSPCSLPRGGQQTWFLRFAAPTQKLKANLLLPFLSQVRVFCPFSLGRKHDTTDFLRNTYLIAWQNIHFIKMMQNLNSILLHPYSSLNKTVNIGECLYQTEVRAIKLVFL